MIAIERAEVDQFQQIVSSSFGWAVSEESAKDILEKRIRAFGAKSPSDYIQTIAKNLPDDERQALIDSLTVTETYFFRNEPQFKAIQEAALPAIIQARSNERRLEILSVGCASGDEPYSVAILIHNRFPSIRSWNVTIHGIDINEKALDRARNAIYTRWSLRETTQLIQDTYFAKEGSDFRLRDEIRGMVSFSLCNLTEPRNDLWLAGKFDLILCRNVLMYFPSQFAKTVVGKIAHSLAPNGFLFLGHAETLRGLSNEFRICQGQDAFFYQKRKASKLNSESNDLYTNNQGNTEIIPSDQSQLDANWFEKISNSSQRINQMKNELVERNKLTVKLGFQQPVNLDDIRALMEKENFDEALNLLTTHSLTLDLEGQLLRALLLTNLGRYSEAADVCEMVLKLESENIGAHYLNALCKEQEGQFTAAMQEDRLVLQIDPTFAMPCLHLALLTRKLGLRKEEMGYWRQAKRLLLAEKPTRIFLFGGGFGKEALIKMCEISLSELSR